MLRGVRAPRAGPVLPLGGRPRTAPRALPALTRPAPHSFFHLFVIHPFSPPSPFLPFGVPSSVSLPSHPSRGPPSLGFLSLRPAPDLSVDLPASLQASTLSGCTGLPCHRSVQQCSFSAFPWHWGPRGISVPGKCICTWRSLQGTRVQDNPHSCHPGAVGSVRQRWLPGSEETSGNASPM